MVWPALGSRKAKEQNRTSPNGTGTAIGAVYVCGRLNEFRDVTFELIDP